jgi:integrase/recombinase XerD
MIEWLVKYKRHCLAKEVSPNTLKGNAVYLRKFFAWLLTQNISDFRGVREQTVLEFQYHLCEVQSAKGKPYDVRTRNGFLGAVKGFFKYLVEIGELHDSPAEKVTYAKEPSKLPKAILTHSEIKRMLAVCDRGTTLGLRNFCILEVLYDAATRNEETRDILLQHVDLVEGRLWIEDGKGGAQGVVPLGKWTCRHLAFYIEHVRPQLLKGKPSDHLFIGMAGEAAGRGLITNAIKQMAQRAGIKKHVTPHLIRHSIATMLLQGGGDIRIIQKYLRHRSLQSTQKYTHVAQVDVQRMFKACHPREREALEV